MCMYIKYNGQSFLDLLNEELILCHFERVSTRNNGLGREMTLGKSTYYRPKKANYDARFSSDLAFNVSLIKKDLSTITDDEKRIINMALTRNHTAAKLYILDDENVEYCKYYIGMFTDINEQLGDTTQGYTMTFTCVSPEYYELKNYSYSVVGTQEIVLNIDTDSPCFPIIKITPKQENITIQNLYDNNDKYIQMKNKSYIKTLDGKTILYRSSQKNSINLKNLVIDYDICIDCERRKIKNSNNVNMPISSVCEDNMYWLMLLNGENRIIVTGDCEIEFECELSRRGGVIDEI